MTPELGEAKRIVVVDDEPDFLGIVKEWLSPDYDVVALSDPAALPEELEEGLCDLLILDVRLPGRDGIELCRELRCDSRFSSLPVMFLTGSRVDEDFIRSLDAGGACYMTKPVTRHHLVARIRELTRH